MVVVIVVKRKCEGGGGAAVLVGIVMVHTFEVAFMVAVQSKNW